MNDRLRRRAAFTLLEVLLVLVILGLLATLVAPQLFGVRDQANIDKARIDINTLHSTCDLYNLHLNSFPANLDQLVNNDGQSAKWRGPYLDKLPADPWGNAYAYEPQSSGKPKIYSHGPDGQAGNDDDVYREEEQTQ